MSCICYLTQLSSIPPSRNSFDFILCDSFCGHLAIIFKKQIRMTEAHAYLTLLCSTLKKNKNTKEKNTNCYSVAYIQHDRDEINTCLYAYLQVLLQIGKSHITSPLQIAHQCYLVNFLTFLLQLQLVLYVVPTISDSKTLLLVAIVAAQ